MSLEVLVDPSRMLRVRYLDLDAGELDLAVVACRYVPAVDTWGNRGVAVELVFDSAVALPNVAYYCPRGRIVRHLITPGHLVQVSPYEP